VTTRTRSGRVKTSVIRVLTTLLDYAGFPAAEIAALYAERWQVEENFQASKRLTGLDEHQVRRWGSWYRWTTLAMLAIAGATEHPPPAGQIPLTQRDRHDLRLADHRASPRYPAPPAMVRLAATPPASHHEVPGDGYHGHAL
jgi:Transposase DDE domain